jgi:hypothetical protein
MIKKKRTGLQIRFNSESEQDVVEFFSTLKKSEVHVTAVSAIRTYMRVVGFYDRRWLESSNAPNMLKQREVCNPDYENKKVNYEIEGLVDEEAFKTLGSMFENENELNN